MSKLSDLELNQESKHYMAQFIGRVFAGTVYEPKNDLYAIKSPWRPGQQSWQPTSTVPQTMAQRADDLKRRVLSGEDVPNLPAIRRDFADICTGLKQVSVYLALTPENDRPKLVKENVDQSLPNVEGFIRVADEKLAQAPASP